MLVAGHESETVHRSVAKTVPADAVRAVFLPACKGFSGIAHIRRTQQQPAFLLIFIAGGLCGRRQNLKGDFRRLAVLAVNDHAALANIIAKRLLHCGISLHMIAIIRGDQQHVISIQPGYDVLRLHQIRCIAQIAAEMVQTEQVVAQLVRAFYLERLQQRHGRGIQDGNVALFAPSKLRDYLFGPMIASGEGITESLVHPVQQSAVIHAAPAVGRNAACAA